MISRLPRAWSRAFAGRANQPKDDIIKHADPPIRIDAVVFDLDGTLLDTLQDLADSANAALEQLGYPTHAQDAYRRFIGGGLRDLVERILPTGEREDDQVETCIQELRRQYEPRWAATSRPYPGIADLLDTLSRSQIPMAVLSNKPHDFAVVSVQRLLQPWSFAIVRGADALTPPKPDPTGALYVAAALDVAPQHVLYVGDTPIDMDTAAAAGMVSVGVTWGFRGEAELRDHGAQHVIHRPVELLDLI